MPDSEAVRIVWGACVGVQEKGTGLKPGSGKLRPPGVGETPPWTSNPLFPSLLQHGWMAQDEKHNKIWVWGSTCVKKYICFCRRRTTRLPKIADKISKHNVTAYQQGDPPAGRVYYWAIKWCWALLWTKNNYFFFCHRNILDLGSSLKGFGETSVEFTARMKCMKASGQSCPSVRHWVAGWASSRFLLITINATVIVTICSNRIHSQANICMRYLLSQHSPILWEVRLPCSSKRPQHVAAK